MRGPLQRDAIAIGIYEIDSHNVTDPTDRNSRCSGEGAVNLMDATGPYQIPYGVMVPKNRDGLLVPVAISATHVALSSVRMEPVWSALGEAAGVAASMALKGGKELRDVDVSRLQQALLTRGCKLFFYPDVDARTEDFAAIQRMSLLGAADGDATYRFHPEQAIPLGEFCRLVVAGMDIPISITAAHFRDAPRGHPYYKYIETVYDLNTESGKSFFPFEVRKNPGSPTMRDAAAFVHPDSSVTGAILAKILTGALAQKHVPVPPLRVDAGHPVTRAEACRIVASVRRSLGL